MKKAIVVPLLLAIAALSGAAEEIVTVPWIDFEKLYRESVERELKEAEPEEEERDLYTIEEALYSFDVGDESASARVLLSGKVLSGEPDAIPLFKTDVIVSSMERVEGGNLVSDGEGVSLIPAGEGDFQVVLSLLAPVEEDGRSRYVRLGVPYALKNGLTVNLSAGDRLLEHPGIVGAEGTIHFAPRSELTVRFEEEGDPSSAGALEIDTLTVVRLEGKKLFFETHFVPSRPVPSPFRIRLTSEARYLSSSLKGSWIKPVEDGALLVTLPEKGTIPFTVDYVLDRDVTLPSTFSLPSVPENRGSEGIFFVEEPEGGEIDLTGEGFVKGLSPSRLPAGLRSLPDKRADLSRIAPGGRARLVFTPFETVRAPEVVLDNLSFFTSFEEGGRVLSVLRMELPPGMGPRFQIGSVPGAEIWSLRVNGKSKNLYTVEEESWIIPLSGDEKSLIELAFLRKEEKLGLRGRLEVLLPETGISARNVTIGVALPPRVELLAVEGDLAPVPEGKRSLPAEFIGERYFFALTFYKGEGMTVPLFYKEPVEIGKRRK